VREKEKSWPRLFLAVGAVLFIHWGLFALTRRCAWMPFLPVRSEASTDFSRRIYPRKSLWVI
jgi:hypothetical protein